MNRLFLFFFCTLSSFLFSEEFLFRGKHFIASYLDCNPEALADCQELIQVIDQAVHASGATILNQSHYLFPPNGLTIVYLLSESHASLHTYPEHGSCFVDLFTCGDHCSSEKFDQVLREYLQPKTVNARLLIRDSDAVQVSK
jgi:S-adenosylmethionine decarboxylase